ncbi:hypothetical protein ACFSUK_08380 [Sphingobium scionense]
MEPGKIADLLLLDADPLADIHNIRGLTGCSLRARRSIFRPCRRRTCSWSRTSAEHKRRRILMDAAPMAHMALS